MPRSKSPRKYKSHKNRTKHRRRSDSRDKSDSRSRSRSKSRSPPRQKHKNHYRKSSRSDSHSRRNGYKHRRGRYSRSRSSDRGRRRSSSSYDKEIRRLHKYDKKRKHHKDYEKREKNTKHSSYSKASGGKKHKKDSDDGKNRSKDAGHYQYKEGTIIDRRYKVVKHLGDGTFGRVVEVEDMDTSKHYAMKVIRAVSRYVESAEIEADILIDIRNKDPDDRYKIVRMEKAFLKDPSRSTKEQNYFMIFEKLGKSLYDFLKMNGYRGFPIENVQSFAQQTLMSIGFMHSIGLTHTDLKPENILLVNDDYIKVESNKNSTGADDSSSKSYSSSEEGPYMKLKDDRIKIIDMGGATYDHERHSSIINTRQYRAPEVMLGCCQWNNSSDVWSIGCILLELFSGNLFFETHETYEHLAMIDKYCGPIPYWMGNRADSSSRKYFKLDDEYYQKHGTFFDFPKHASGMSSIKRVQTMKSINEVIPAEYPEFRDLVKKMLVIDPKLRIKCKDALEHEFFKVNYKDKK